MSQPLRTPVVSRLSDWLDPEATGPADPQAVAALERRDARLSETRAALLSAEDIVRSALGREPLDAGPSAAAELDRIAERLGSLAETYPSSDRDPVVVQRAAVLCAGAEWDLLPSVLPLLTVRIAASLDAIAETAVRLDRLTRTSRPVATVPAAEQDPLKVAEAAICVELRRRTAKAGAEAAHLAADAAVLTSLSDFLR